MFGYYVDLALRSLRRNPILTGLMVLAIGLGIGASMTMLTVLHVMSGDPLPERSAQLFYPHLDPLTLKYQKSAYGPDPSVNFTWPDAMALLAALRAERQAAMVGGDLLARPAQAGRQPFHVDGRYTSRAFFAMVLGMWLPGQLAVLSPALRAAWAGPVMATRGMTYPMHSGTGSFLLRQSQCPQTHEGSA